MKDNHVSKEKKTSVQNDPEKMVSATLIPQHPYMAPNGYSNTHCDAYMSDTYTYSGPLGKEHTAKIYTKRYPLASQGNLDRTREICITVAFNKEGQLITLGNIPNADTGDATHELLLMDPKTLTILASVTLPAGGGGESSFGCGGYLYLDQNYRVVVPMATGEIGIYKVVNTSGSYSFEFVTSYNPKLPNGSSIVSALPDWSGRIWVVTGEGYVACVDPNDPSNPQLIQLKKNAESEDEVIANSFAVDATGGVFIASDHAMYRLDYNASLTNKIVTTWREAYDRGDRIKPGQKSQGTGTTPTLMDVGGSYYVGITDNADPQMNVCVYYRKKQANGVQLCGKVPVFQDMESDTENSLIGINGAFIVENNYGYLATPVNPPTENTIPGVASIQYTETPGMETWSLVWNNPDYSIPSLVSKASIPDGLVYTYTLNVVDGVPKWYFTCLDVNTGGMVLNQWVGDKEKYDNYYSAIAISPLTGDAYIPVWGGMVKITNQA